MDSPSIAIPARPLRRAFIIVLDGLGCGEAPDAAAYGDQGSNTLGNLSRSFTDGLRLPNLGSLGLGNIIPVRGVPPRPIRRRESARGGFGQCAERSAGKDSTSGHWEIAGVVSRAPFPVYPHGFPREIIRAFEGRVGRGTLANRPASGTEIIQELGAEHLQTGKLIVYTSADSVFQIAAHESVVPPEELYRACEAARAILTGPHRVGRVIARPFEGEPGAFRRTAGRRDFSVPPPEPTLLDHCRKAGIRTIGVGKIGDLFAERGLDEILHTKSNAEGEAETERLLREAPAPALVFVNLVEGDSTYGHRNDQAGYRRCMEQFDASLGRLFRLERPGDLLVITADHGVDPTTRSTDHSRERTPLLAWGPGLARGVNLGIRESFTDIGATVADWLGAPAMKAGRSFLPEIAAPAALES